VHGIHPRQLLVILGREDRGLIGGAVLVLLAGFQICGELGHGLDRRLGADGEHERDFGVGGDRGEILHRVERQILEQESAAGHVR
jgi:hypothetical protein